MKFGIIMVMVSLVLLTVVITRFVLNRVGNHFAYTTLTISLCMFTLCLVGYIGLSLLLGL